MFSSGPLKQSDAYRLDQMERQLRGLMSPIVCGVFGMVRAADGRPIIYNLDFGQDSNDSNLNVCGSPVVPDYTQSDDAECVPCNLTEEDVDTIEDVEAIVFEKCDFIVDQRNECGVYDDIVGSSSGNGVGGAAHVRLGGLTGEVQLIRNVIFCPDTCELLFEYRILCFRNGLYTGFRDGPDEVCP